jgi:protein-S-isoprenylcysteine O-methyltransferase Ste14
MKPHLFSLLLRWSLITASLSALLFLAAGTSRIASLRAYLALFSVWLLVTMLAVDPRLARERADPQNPGIGDGLRFATGFFFLLTLTVAAFFAGHLRFGLNVPTPIRHAALVAFVLSGSLQTWAMIANPFFSPVVRIQADRGHKLIDSGPYRFMKHPGYFAMCVSVPASAVAIGSWLALIPAGAFIAVIRKRARFEEQFLKASLPGYAQYAKTFPSGLFHFRST